MRVWLKLPAPLEPTHQPPRPRLHPSHTLTHLNDEWDKTDIFFKAREQEVGKKLSQTTLYDTQTKREAFDKNARKSCIYTHSDIQGRPLFPNYSFHFFSSLLWTLAKNLSFSCKTVEKRKWISPYLIQPFLGWFQNRLLSHITVLWHQSSFYCSLKTPSH